MARLGVKSGNSLIEARKAAKRFREGLPRAMNLSSIAAESAAKVRFASRLSDRIRAETSESRGRAQAAGGLASHIRYQVNKNITVSLDRKKLDRATRVRKGHPYWMIQEIGTGQSAAYKTVDAQGEVKSHSFAIKSQVGRRLPRGLQWHEGGGVYVPPLASVRTHQIEVFDPSNTTLTEQQRFMRTRHQIQIRREIQGKHYIKRGTSRGAQVLRDELNQLLGKTLKSRGKK